VAEATKQRKAACSSCPWVVDGDRAVHFDPETLEKTVVDSLRHGNIHSCHSATEFMCSGYLAFAEANLPGRAYSLQMVRIASRLGMFDHSIINKDLNVFASVKKMLADHKKRSRRKY
jgi:hypothetical protein